MTTLTSSVKFYGKDAPLPTQLQLKAGPFSLVYEKGFLRYISLGHHEVLRMMYFALRDHNWDTIPAKIVEEKVNVGDEYFAISYQYEHDYRDISFVWNCLIKGSAEGLITFEIEGEALSSFERNRAGFCIHHPASFAGKACKVTHSDSSQEEGQFPVHISPHQPFVDIVTIEWLATDTSWASLKMEGDIFEMEDQRNWTDASYKTYCTPLSKPFPLTLKTGDRVYQKLTLSLIGEPDISEKASQESLSIIIHPEQVVPLPSIGIGQSSTSSQLSQGEVELLQAPNFQHYRVDVFFEKADWEVAVKNGKAESNLLHIPLEWALFLTDRAEEEISRFIECCHEVENGIASIIVFHHEETCTPSHFPEKIIPRLKAAFPDVPVGAGTNCYFTELNRLRVPTEGVDFLAYSINPQVHAFDNASLVETLETQSFTVSSAKAFSHGLPIHVSPITLQPRFNPNATGPIPAVPEGELPPEVDVRQMSLFGAVWTLGSIKHLATAGPASLTYYETVGWRGIMQGDVACEVPDKFYTRPGQLFPLYYLFEKLGGFLGGKIVEVQTNDPLVFEGMLLRKGDEENLLVANFTAQVLEIKVKGWDKFDRMEVMDEVSFPGFRSYEDPVHNGLLKLSSFSLLSLS